MEQQQFDSQMRYNYAKYVYDNVADISRAYDARANFLVVINTGLLAGLAFSVVRLSDKYWLTNPIHLILIGVAGLIFISAVICLIVAIKPRLQDPNSPAGINFIARETRDSYLRKSTRVSMADIVDEMSRENYALCCAVTRKESMVNKGVFLSLVGMAYLAGVFWYLIFHVKF